VATGGAEGARGGGPAHPARADRGRLVERALERVAEREAQLRAWTALVPPERVRAAAAEARGPLAGLPVGVKDVLDTVDLPTAYGSPRWAGHHPTADATVVRRLRDAGAVVMGKTVSTEFALFDPPVTVNPHDPARTPGGSSSGSAAAVGAGMVPLALGTQTVGSVVRPASFCGVWGLVPSPGLVPRDGVRALAPSLDRVGLLAASADLLASALPVLADRPPAPARARRSRRFALVRAVEWEAADPATRALLEGTARRLGADELTLPAPCSRLADAHRTVLGPEAALALGEEADAGAAPSVTATVREGRAVPATDYLAALALLEVCRAAVAQLAAPYDALLVPAAVGEAPPRATTGDPVMNRAWTALGMPLLAVPGALGPAGLPIGVQLVGRPGRDLDLLAAGRRVAEALAPGA
jgi:Asp-tRNA(Asn)/Glu-tRNA(Gln) amidotransferase A subunit family amidase